MLASIRAKRPPRGDAWLHEVKWDGYRALARLADGEPYLWSRRGQRPGRALPAHPQRPRARPAQPELRRGRRGRRLRRTRACPASTWCRRRRARSACCSSTCWSSRARELYGPRLEDFRALLEGLVDETSATVRLSRAFDDGEGLLAAARERGLEGVISKRRSSKYVAGGRARALAIKVKAALPRTGSRSIALRRRRPLPQPPRLPGRRTRGGRRAALRRARRQRPLGGGDRSPARAPRAAGARVAARRRCRRCPRSEARRLRWVEPAYEAEVEYAEVSSDGLLRQPRYAGLRERKG